MFLINFKKLKFSELHFKKTLPLQLMKTAMQSFSVDTTLNLFLILVLTDAIQVIYFKMSITFSHGTMQLHVSEN